jgi:hypothetical protein
VVYYIKLVIDSIARDTEKRTSKKKQFLTTEEETASCLDLQKTSFTQ